jgi:hypothetical protein
MAILPFTPAGLTEVRPPLRKAWVLIFVLLAGYAVAVGATIASAAITLAFWQHGVERTAHVHRLDSQAPGRVPTWSYEIDVGGRVFVNEFTSPLDPGKDVQVLEVPGRQEVIAGTRQSSPLQIFMTLQGGGVMAWIAAAVFPLLVLAGPFAFVSLVRRARR